MDRRKFLSQSPILGAGLIGISGVTDTRLYGQPKSSVSRNSALESMAPHLMRLHYSIEGLDPSRGNAYPAISRLAKDILLDRTVAERFAQDPEAYLQQIGFGESNFDTSSAEFKMVQALADPDVRKAAAAKDHIAFVNAVNRLNLQRDMLASDTVVQQPQSEPCCANTNVSVNVTVNINVAGTATVVALSIAFVVAAVVAAVVVAVAGEDPPPVYVFVAGETGGPPPVLATTVANALGGQTFSQDVMRFEARNKVTQLISAISDGSLQLPDGLTSQDAIAGLNHALEKHFF